MEVPALSVNLGNLLTMLSSLHTLFYVSDPTKTNTQRTSCNWWTTADTFV